MSGEPTWQVYAACRADVAAHFFAPTHFEVREERRAREAQAREICAGCPVRTPCLEYALVIGERYGIWGGLTELQRRRLARRRSA